MTVAQYQHAACSALRDYSTSTQSKVIRAYYSGIALTDCIAALR